MKPFFRHYCIDLGCTYKSEYADESLVASSTILKPRASSMVSSRPKTAPSKPSPSPVTDSLPQDIDLIHYLYYISRQKVGLQHHDDKRRPPTEFRESYNLNHPELRKGQKIYLNNLCQIYSIKDLISGKKKQYTDTLKHRKTTGISFLIFKKILFFMFPVSSKVFILEKILQNMKNI